MAYPVSLQPCGSYDLPEVNAALSALLAPLGGLAAFVKAGDNVVLKPNLLSASAPEKCATTHPAVVEAVARGVIELGGRPVIADSPAWGGPVRAARATGMRDVCERLGIEFVDLNHRRTVRCCRPEVTPHVHIDPHILDADVVINIGKLKAHQQAGFTAATKNLFGAVAGREKAFCHLAHSRTDMNFCRFIAAYSYTVPCALHITDAIIGMEGPGPRLGTPRRVGLLAASRGQAELDAVIADWVGAPATHTLILQACRDLGLGETDVAKIEILGPDCTALRLTDYVWPAQIGVFFSPWRLIRGWIKNQHLLRHDV